MGHKSHQLKWFIGETMVYTVTADTIAEAWVKAVCLVYNHGKLRKTEYDNNALTLSEPLVIHVNKPFMAPQTCDKFSKFKTAFIKEYRSQFLFVGDTGHSYTYPNRLFDYISEGIDSNGFFTNNYYGNGKKNGFDQIEHIISALCDSDISRRQIAHTWYPKIDAFMDSAPCLQDVQFAIDNKTLNMVAHFRSNDILDAWLSNANGLDALQNFVGKNIYVINKDVVHGTGYLETYSMFPHIYESRLDDAQKISDNTYWGKCYAARL